MSDESKTPVHFMELEEELDKLGPHITEEKYRDAIRRVTERGSYGYNKTEDNTTLDFEEVVRKLEGYRITSIKVGRSDWDNRTVTITVGCDERLVERRLQETERVNLGGESYSLNIVPLPPSIDIEFSDLSVRLSGFEGLKRKDKTIEDIEEVFDENKVRVNLEDSEKSG